MAEHIFFVALNRYVLPGESVSLSMPWRISQLTEGSIVAIVHPKQAVETAVIGSKAKIYHVQRLDNHRACHFDVLVLGRVKLKGPVMAAGIAEFEEFCDENAALPHHPCTLRPVIHGISRPAWLVKAASAVYLARQLQHDSFVLATSVLFNVQSAQFSIVSVADAELFSFKLLAMLVNMPEFQIESLFCSTNLLHRLQMCQVFCRGLHESTLRCTSCLSPVCDVSDIFRFGQKAGLFQHVNPHGFNFQVITTRQARNVTQTGLPSSENSWFEGTDRNYRLP